MRKYVLTGGPCSGKTTLINELRKNGFSVLDETAREVLSSALISDKVINNKENYEKLEIEIFQRQLKKESSLCKKTLLYFLDRGTIDCLAYSEVFLGYVPEEIAIHTHSGRYDKVFALERLPFVNDGVRVEGTEEEAKKIHDFLIKTYLDYGYELIHVPVMSVEERMEFILRCIKSCCLNRYPSQQGCLSGD